MSSHVRCPGCSSLRHVAYSRGRRRYRAVLLGNVASKGRECSDCGLVFLVHEVADGTPEAAALLEVARNRT